MTTTGSSLAEESSKFDFSSLRTERRTCEKHEECEARMNGNVRSQSNTGSHIGATGAEEAGFSGQGIALGQ